MMRLPLMHRRRLLPAFLLLAALLAPGVVAAQEARETSEIITVEVAGRTFRLPLAYLPARPPAEALERMRRQQVNRWNSFGFAFQMPGGQPLPAPIATTGRLYLRPEEMRPSEPEGYAVLISPVLRVQEWREGMPAEWRITPPERRLRNILLDTRWHEYGTHTGMIEIRPLAGQEHIGIYYYGSRLYPELGLAASFLMNWQALVLLKTWEVRQL
ncbi:hypothetical protein HB662_16855 [Roseomonas frigidaquae]|uniref:Uncharacterized protein n=1 Tax=Falsiroseomonas frigidaquae TaxID=487318 RepID=A0ABX1F285_9PROT|nr:hypothetical protein [Falsiroseomonas frigidaquae]NKE46455.1 hypothetical protein [Falsiroseomonas frigidaquae]